MAGLAAASFTVLPVTAALLLWIAFADLREFRIRNELVVILAALWLVHAALSGRWVIAHWNIGFALAMFAAMLWCYRRNLMGGGDLKLLTVGFLWTGLHCAVPFLLFMAVFAGLHALAARFGWVEAQRVNGRIRVAFAPSIAAGLIGAFLTGCLASL